MFKMLALVFVLCCGFSTLQAQNKAATKTANGDGTFTVTNPDLPGFPSYIVTGDAEVDAANYNAAKLQWLNQQAGASQERTAPMTETEKNAWIEANQAEYRGEQIQVTRAEFDAMPAEKQADIKKDARFIIVEPKN